MVYGGQRHERSVITACCVLACICVCASPVAAAFDTRLFDSTRINLDLAVSSDYVVYGVTRSQGKPIAQAQLGWTGDSGWTAGTWLSSIDLNPGHGPRLELDPYLGKRWVLGRDWSVRSDLTRYIFRPSLERVAYDYTELRAAASFRDVLEFAVGFSPDYSGYSRAGLAHGRTMLIYEAAAHFPATRWLSLNAGAGRRDLQDAYGASYWYWSGGAETTLNRMSVALTYIGTSHTALDLFGTEYAGDRVVATVALRLK